MILQRNNFGLTGLSNYDSYDDGYDHLFKKLKERREAKKEEKEDKKAEKKQRKEDKRSERQEKRELSSEKKRLKNEMKQTQIDEKKAQLTMLNQAGAAPPSGNAPTPAGSDNTMMIVAAVVGVVVIAGVGYVIMNKKPAPVTAPVYSKAA